MKYQWDYDSLNFTEYNRLINEFIKDKTLEIIN